MDKGEGELFWQYYLFHRKTNPGSLQKVNEKDSVTALETRVGGTPENRQAPNNKPMIQFAKNRPGSER